MSYYHDDDAAENKADFDDKTSIAPILSDFKKEIANSRAILRSISSSYRVRNCQRYSNGTGGPEQTIVIENGKVVQSSFSSQSICERASCPNCGQMRAAKAEKMLEHVINGAITRGGKAQLIVATSRNAAAQDHEELRKVQAKAFKKFSKSIKRERYSIAGIIHMPEISYTEKGLNPHSNIVIIYSAGVTETVMKQVENVFARLWIDVHEYEGFARPTRKNGVMGQEIHDAESVSGYLTKSYKHGYLPKSTYNSGWFPENGELREGRALLRSPHDILRMINKDPKLRRYFLPLTGTQEIIRMGKLDFAVKDNKDGTITDLKKLPILVRHWLDYETTTKGTHIISLSEVSKNPLTQPQKFWKEVCDEMNLAMVAPTENRTVITIPYNLQEWLKTGGSVDLLMAELNMAALSVKDSADVVSALNREVDNILADWDMSRQVQAVA